MATAKQDHEIDRSDYFPSRRTPLNFLALFLTAMNSPEVLSRLVQLSLPIVLLARWVRFFTAPLAGIVAGRFIGGHRHFTICDEGTGIAPIAPLPHERLVFLSR